MLVQARSSIRCRPVFPRSIHRIHQSDTSEKSVGHGGSGCVLSGHSQYPNRQPAIVARLTQVRSCPPESAAVLSSSGTPARILARCESSAVSSPGRDWRRQGQMWRLGVAPGNPVPAILACSGASVCTAVVQRVTEAVERLRLLCGGVEKQTDNGPARPLCYLAADANSRAIGRGRPRRIPPHSSFAWVATISTQARPGVGGPSGPGAVPSGA